MSQAQSRGLPVRFSLEHLLILTIAIGLLLRLLNLAAREFWYDEPLSVLLSSGQRLAYQLPSEGAVPLAQLTALLSLPPETGLKGLFSTLINLLRGVAGGEPHPPLFFLSQHFWMRLLGNGEAATRSLGALLSGGAIAAAYGLGRITLGHRGGLLLAALLAVNPFYLFHSLNLRMYGPLVLWAVLSGAALLHLMPLFQPSPDLEKTEDSENPTQVWLWTGLLIVSVFAGLMTFYLFAYWVFTLGILVLLLDRKHWWQQGLRLGVGVVLCLPWMVWGFRQQLRNADFKRFGAGQGGFLQHLQDTVQPLGIHLVLGDWVTQVSPLVPTLCGSLVAGLMLVGSWMLWKQGEVKLLKVALLMALLPLALGLMADLVGRKFTIAFGYGRSMIVILPGCLLFLALWLERAAGKWQKPAIALILLVYLSVSTGDALFRQRQMFRTVNAEIQANAGASTLVALNSRAWGHVLRLAYFVSPQAPVDLLPQPAAKLAPALQTLLANPARPYQWIFWLDSQAPLWSPPTTETEQQQIQQVLQQRCQFVGSQTLRGTMDLDQFKLNRYRCASS